MSSGSKINHASDNAANYSITTNMSTKISAYQVAEDNVNMGLDMLATTSDALDTIGDKLSHMRALAIQAQNGTSGNAKAMNSEATALLDEINRINETATYNGIKLFNTGKQEVSNTGKELSLNSQGFINDVSVVDTSTMTKVADIDETASLTAGSYAVSTIDDILKLDRMSKAGLITSSSEFVLANDIDLKSYCQAQSATGGWSPITLTGIFNGNGHTISNLYIKRPGQSYQGFFNKANQVKNLRLENVDITAKSYFGGIAALNTKVDNCSVTGKLTGDGYIGGIEGNGYYADVKNCYANVIIKGNNTVGGIYGFGNYSEVFNCFSEGSVTGNYSVGGIGGNVCDVKNCKSTANVQGNTSVGGLVGYASRAIISSYFGGTVVANTKNGGGIAGAQLMGGFVDCINEGKIIGYTTVGAIVGKYDGGNNNPTIIKNCYYDSKDVVNGAAAGDMTGLTFDNVVDICIPTDYVLQVGITGDSNSASINLSTYIEFSGLSKVLANGLEDSDTIAKIDDLENQVALKQTEIATAQNRLFGVLDEISTQYENLVSSRSTLRDADVGEIASEYIRQQILQEASATLMSTANQTPALALQLL